MQAGTSEVSVFRQGVALIVRSIRLRPLGHVVSTLGAIAYGLASIELTSVLGRATDDVIEPGFGDGIGASEIRFVAIIFLLVGLVRATGAMCRRWFLSWSEFGTQMTWRNQLLDRYIDTPMSFHHRTPAGRLLAHADADTEAATRMLKPLPFAIGTMAMAIAALVRLLQIDVLLALVALVLFPALSILNRLYTSRVAVLAVKERKLLGTVSSIAHESFDGALVVKTLGREASEVERLDGASEELQDIRIRIGRIRGTFEPILEALPNLGIIALLLIGASLVGDGSVTTGELVQAMAMFTILAVPVRIVGFFLQELPSSVAALAQVDGILAEPNESTPEHAAQLPDGPLSITLDNVHFQFGDSPVLRGVTAEIAAGESVAIVGSTGSGKSTIGNLLVQLIDPESGEVRVGGMPLRSIPRPVLSEAVSVVFQEAFLFADTLRENITLGIDYPEEELRNALRIVRADGFVDALPEGLDTVVGERGVTLSGGQRQRIALARALVRRPRILILDDATSAVDPTIEAEILQGLRSSLHTTLVVVAYRLATIRLADRVLYIDGGQIAAQGSHQDLMANEDYANLIRAYEEATEASR